MIRANEYGRSPYHQETGTLAELNVQVGNVVECVGNYCAEASLDIGGMYEIGDKGLPIDNQGDQFLWTNAQFRIVSRAKPQGPVITETVTTTTKRIVNGVYDRVEVQKHGSMVGIIIDAYFTVDDLTAAIETLTQIRDAMAPRDAV